ncbi:hypothetical protein BY996DRAFT_4586715, partial [Phakopsora pachyrhizi]
LPNPQSLKAQGKMIRHVPLKFYSYNTRGILSKQWNKHISIMYRSPLQYSNQEYNTIFVATSNIESALKLCATVVEELNTVCSTGFQALNSSLNEYVWIIPVILLFMNYSIMHAEISSTIFIGHSQNCVQVCNNLHFMSSTSCFDGHKDTPVEVLHLVLLEIIKHLYHDLIGGLSADKKEVSIAMLQSFDTLTLISHR